LNTDDKNIEDTVLKIYAEIKLYQKHEDGLIVSRLSSLTFVSSFMFAGIALASSNIYTLYNFKLINGHHFGIPVTVSAYFALMLMFGLGGAFCARYCIRGIIAARQAIDQLKLKWTDVDSAFPTSATIKLLPGIVDGGKAADESVHRTWVWRVLHPFFADAGDQNSDSNSFGIAGTLLILWSVLWAASLIGIVLENWFGDTYFGIDKLRAVVR